MPPLPTSAKFSTYAPKYLAYLIGIVCTWAVVTLGRDPVFAALTQQGSLVGLTIVTVGWIGACAAHYTLTGDPSPVAPLLAAARTQETTLPGTPVAPGHIAYLGILPQQQHPPER